MIWEFFNPAMSAEQAKRLFRELATKHHPDKHANPKKKSEAEKLFTKVTEEYYKYKKNKEKSQEADASMFSGFKYARPANPGKSPKPKTDDDIMQELKEELLQALFGAAEITINEIAENVKNPALKTFFKNILK